MGTECQKDYSDEDQQMLDEAEGRTCGLPEGVIEREMPAIEKALNERFEVMAEARVEKHIQEGSKKVPEGELTPEKAESLFRNEKGEWRQEVRDAISGYRYINEVKTDKDGQILGSATSIKSKNDNLPVGTRIDLFKQSLSEARITIIHEFAEVDYELMPQGERKRFEKEIWPTTDKTKEIEFFDKWVKGEGKYAVSKGSKEELESQQNYCFWMTAFRCETHERLQELKETNPAKFNFCKERHRADEIERLSEKVREGNLISF
ncbi:MAG: hypothetical protein A2998_01790 [Candidatus Staskawiczbacteria bacterium RIFCSPLOWO2_01_FULL_37_25b]|uniref:Uncharacterized protein n=1 Tax=Candidatus Staskawiczbacteria bacterium RIFCSPLOWO2_01_FULL_37_25b TaxID=1802213 RepID=A0A1G2IDD0_9BACT|nr:MAG: hypothetical protein A2998_01790 [Candidatus Staskawiczbacteria bacterium RIFCSPLOWO2_01_FULL_37_25b]